LHIRRRDLAECVAGGGFPVDIAPNAHRIFSGSGVFVTVRRERLDTLTESQEECSEET